MGTPTGIDLSHRDHTVRPQDDLFRHVNGGWLTTAEIPADRATDGAFHQLRDDAEAHLRALVEALPEHAPAGSEAQQVGDLYRSFLDEDHIEGLDLAPIADDLAAVDALEDLSQLAALLGRFGRFGMAGLFGVSVFADARASDQYAAYLGQAGLGLPDEAFYREDAFEGLRSAYHGHVAAMLALLGCADDDAESAATTVLRVETALASHHWDQVRDRDAEATYNRHSRAELEARCARFDWTAWLQGLDAPDSLLDGIVVREPSFLEGLDVLLAELSLDDWKVWLRWHLIDEVAPLLSSRFVEQDFDFHGRTLTGAPELRARWKRAVATVEGAMGEALGKLYVAEHFAPAAKEEMLTLVGHLLDAYRASITSLDWMTDDTRARALAKLDTFTPKIGYPDRWRDYSKLEIRPGDLVGNLRRAASFETDRALGRIGQPVDRDEWFMSPQTVNAYYNPLLNEIVFPAAILRPPFFHPGADAAVNFGAIGAVIGHEIGHGFDDQGSRYDGSGNLNDWWTEQDREAFEARTAALIAQYDALEPRQAPGHHVNGAFTIGENIGDLGGLAIAYAAWKASLGGQDAPAVDGLTGAQRFFWSWAQAWRTMSRDEEVVRLLAVDPHSPPEFRCNAVVRNLPGFHDAFETTESDELWLDPTERVSIW